MKKVIIWHLGTASTLLITQDKCGLLEVLATIKDKKKGKGYFRNKQWKECFISERNRTSEYIWNWFKGLFSFSTKELEPVRKLPLPCSKLCCPISFLPKVDGSRASCRQEILAARIFLAFMDLQIYVYVFFSEEEGYRKMHVLFVPAFLRVNSKLFASQLKTSRDPIHLDFSPVVFSLIRQVCTFCRLNWYNFPWRSDFLADSLASVCAVHHIYD